MTNDIEIIDRVQALVSDDLPKFCGVNCPMLCCDPIITVCFLEKKIFKESDNYKEVRERLDKHIEKFLLNEKANNEEIFSLQHVYLTDIKGDFAGFTEDQIKENISELVKKPLTKQEMDGMVLKAKIYLKENQLQFIFGFQCKYLKDSVCSIYDGRPNVCKDFTCFQLQKEFGKKDKKELFEYLTVKKEQRKRLKSSGDNILEAIIDYFDRDAKNCV